jgi:hypothetical protein
MGGDDEVRIKDLALTALLLDGNGIGIGGAGEWAPSVASVDSAVNTR